MSELDQHNRILRLERVIFGEESINEKGIKEKVDEMHKILTQAKGMPWLLAFIVLLGGAIAVFKGWFIK